MGIKKPFDTLVERVSLFFSPVCGLIINHIFKHLHGSMTVMKSLNLVALVPVKGLDASKERLSSVLSPEGRRALSAAMLKDVLNALKSSTIRKVLLISPDSLVRQIAEKFGCWYISQRQVGLNQALKEALDWCMQRSVDAVLILPADIPLISAKDIDKLVELGCENSTTVLSPSLNGGTNALFLNPPDLITFFFGHHSFYKHVKEAIAKGVSIKFYSSRGVMLDVDSAEDLNKMLQIAGNLETKQSFEQAKRLEKTRK